MPFNIAHVLQLVRNMGTIDQPWVGCFLPWVRVELIPVQNCPHGRPTMRHLTKVETGKSSRSGRGRIDWAKWDQYQD